MNESTWNEHTRPVPASRGDSGGSRQPFGPAATAARLGSAGAAAGSVAARPAGEVAEERRHVRPREPLPQPPERNDRDPAGARGIVGRDGLAAPPAGRVAEGHHREAPETADEVTVPVDPEPLHATEREPRLLLELAARGALEALARLDESPRHVEEAGAWRVRPLEQQHPGVPHDEQARGRARVVVEHVPAARDARVL